jgi:hypothetical protein
LERLRVSAGELAADYLDLAVAQLRAEGKYVNDEALAHISSAASATVSFLGATNAEIDTELARLGRAGYRPLRSSAGDGSAK